MKKSLIFGAALAFCLIAGSCAVKPTALSRPTGSLPSGSSSAEVCSAGSSAGSSSVPAVSSSAAIPASSSRVVSKPAVVSTCADSQTASRAASKPVKKPQVVRPAPKKAAPAAASKTESEKASSGRKMLGTVAYKTYPAFELSDAEFENYQNVGSIVFDDDSFCIGRWEPVNPQATLTKVLAMLKQSTPYTDGVPYETHAISFGANVGPSQVNVLDRQQKRYVTMSPAWYVIPYSDYSFKQVYVPDILKIEDNAGHMGYIRSHDLYDWLLNDRWEAEAKKG